MLRLHRPWPCAQDMATKRGQDLWEQLSISGYSHHEVGFFGSAVTKISLHHVWVFGTRKRVCTSLRRAAEGLSAAEIRPSPQAKGCCEVEISS